MKVQVLRYICVAMLLFAISFPVSATTYTINPDGTGDYPTIQDAIDIAADWDSILLADGVFSGDGNRDISYLGKNISIESLSDNAETCIIDCESTELEPHRGFLFQAEGLSARLSGITIKNGWGAPDEDGGAIKCMDNASPSIGRCIFIDNLNSALYCETYSAPIITQCLFIHNDGTRGGAANFVGADAFFFWCEFIQNTASRGGAVHGHASEPYFQGCLFEENSSGVGGAAAFIYGGGGRFADCFFMRNSAEMTGAVDSHGLTNTNFEACQFIGNTCDQWGIISLTKSSEMEIVNCAFWDNESSYAVIFVEEEQTSIFNSIIAFNRGGGAVFGEATVTLNCCDIYGNEGGDWVGGIADQYGINGNIAADPLFCDPEIADLHLRSDSPCLPFTAPNEECDLIGPLMEGCYLPTATKPTTWGRIKAMHRD